MAALRGFRDLIVYRRAIREAKNVFVMSKAFPSEERYSLTDQIRRSSRAVGSMIAEAWARYPTVDAARLGSTALLRDDRILRVMIARDETPPAFVEWVER